MRQEVRGVDGAPEEVAEALRAIVAERPLADVRAEMVVPLPDWPVAWLMQTESPDDGRAHEALFVKARPGARQVRVNPGRYPFLTTALRLLDFKAREQIGTEVCDVHRAMSVPERARGTMIGFRCPMGHLFWRPLDA